MHNDRELRRNAGCVMLNKSFGTILFWTVKGPVYKNDTHGENCNGTEGAGRVSDTA